MGKHKPKRWADLTDNERHFKLRNEKNRLWCKERRRRRKKQYNSEGKRYLYPVSKYCVPAICFERLVREVAQDFQTDLSFDPHAMVAIYNLWEDYMIDILRATNSIKNNEYGNMIVPKNFQIACRDIPTLNTYPSMG